jgi:hypothetical protein
MATGTRIRRGVTLTLLPEALAVLARLAETHGSRSAAVEAWLLGLPHVGSDATDLDSAHDLDSSGNGRYRSL